MIDLVEDETGLIEQLAHMTHAAFQAHAPGWLPTIQDARDEVLESLEPKKISRVLIDESRQPLGWIAATPHSGGRVWEIHPVAVAPAAQGRGYGRILIADIEQLAQTAGALTLLVGTGDATDATTLSGVDLYADPATAIAGIRALRAHPYSFYVRLGFTVVGLVPDADGIGKPGITLAKRVQAGQGYG
ncbi:MAG: GNAT family N-acetyltransferase [Caldilineaceae bacterium]